MAKKKKSRRKLHRGATATPAVGASKRSSSQVKPAQSTAVASSQPVERPAAVAAPSTASAAAAASAPGRWNYVTADLRRIGILVVICVALEALMWFLINHTGLGSAVYQHIAV